MCLLPFNLFTKLYNIEIQWKIKNKCWNQCLDSIHKYAFAPIWSAYEYWPYPAKPVFFFWIILWPTAISHKCILFVQALAKPLERKFGLLKGKKRYTFVEILLHPGTFYSGVGDYKINGKLMTKQIFGGKYLSIHYVLQRFLLLQKLAKCFNLFNILQRSRVTFTKSAKNKNK